MSHEENSDGIPHLSALVTPSEYEEHKLIVREFSEITPQRILVNEVDDMDPIQSDKQGNLHTSTSSSNMLDAEYTENSHEHHASHNVSINQMTVSTFDVLKPIVEESATVPIIPCYKQSSDSGTIKPDQEPETSSFKALEQNGCNLNSKMDQGLQDQPAQANLHRPQQSSVLMDISENIVHTSSQSCDERILIENLMVDLVSHTLLAHQRQLLSEVLPLYNQGGKALIPTCHLNKNSCMEQNMDMDKPNELEISKEFLDKEVNHLNFGTGVHDEIGDESSHTTMSHVTQSLSMCNLEDIPMTNDECITNTLPCIEQNLEIKERIEVKNTSEYPIHELDHVDIGSEPSSEDTEIRVQNGEEDVSSHTTTTHPSPVVTESLTFFNLEDVPMINGECSKSTQPSMAQNLEMDESNEVKNSKGYLDDELNHLKIGLEPSSKVNDTLLSSSVSGTESYDSIPSCDSSLPCIDEIQIQTSCKDFDQEEKGDLSLDQFHLQRSLSPENATKDHFRKSRERLELKWDKRLQELKSYNLLWGHMNVAPSESRELANWTYEQRYRFHRKELTPERYHKLEAIEFNWIMDKDDSRLQSSKSTGGIIKALQKLANSPINTIFDEEQQGKQSSMKELEKKKKIFPSRKFQTTKAMKIMRFQFLDRRRAISSKITLMKVKEAQKERFHGLKSIGFPWLLFSLRGIDASDLLINFLDHHSLNMKTSTQKSSIEFVSLISEEQESFCNVEAPGDELDSDRIHAFSLNDDAIRKTNFSCCRKYLYDPTRQTAEAMSTFRDAVSKFNKGDVRFSFGQVGDIQRSKSNTSNNKVNQIWEAKFNEVKKFMSENGYREITRGDSNSLNQWIYRQRHRYRLKKLQPDRIQKLLDIGLIVDAESNKNKSTLEIKSNSKVVDEVSDDLIGTTSAKSINCSIDNKEEHPVNSVANEKPSTLNKAFVINTLKAKLRSGLNLNARDKESCLIWITNYDALLRIFRRKGPIEMNKSKNEKRRRWMKYQRMLYREGRMKTEKIEMLNAIGFKWGKSKGEFVRSDAIMECRGQSEQDDEKMCPQVRQQTLETNGKVKSNLDAQLDNAWQLKFQELKEYFKKHGNFDMKESDYPFLNRWTRYQRERNRIGRLAEERRELLDAIGFNWSNSMTQNVGIRSYEKDSKATEARASRVIKNTKDLKEQHVAVVYEKASQENLKSSGCEPQQESVDVRSIRDKDPNWMVKIEKLKRFKKKHGNLNISRASKQRSLSDWVYRQKNKKKRGELKKYQLDCLRNLGFEWASDEGNGGKTEKNSASEALQRHNEGLEIDRSVQTIKQRKQAQAKWISNMKKIKHYKSKYENFKLNGEKNRQLYQWVYRQKMKHRFGMLEKYQLDCLRDLGVEWALENSNQIKSDTNYTSKMLGGKVNKDINTKKASEKSASTIEQSIQGNASNRISLPNTESIEDRSVHSSECTWVEKIEALKEYKTKNGSFDLIRTKNRKLYYWIYDQKRKHQRGIISQSLFRCLREIGIDWAQDESEEMSDESSTDFASGASDEFLQNSTMEFPGANVTIPRTTLMNMIQNFKQRKMAVKDIVNDLEQLLS